MLPECRQTRLLGKAKLFIWGSKSGITTSHQVLWSECGPNLVLQMSKIDDWDYYLDTVGMNLVSQDPCAHCFKSLPPSLSWSDTHDMRSEWEAGCLILGSLFPLRNQWLRVELPSWSCVFQGQKQCGQHLASSFILLVQSPKYVWRWGEISLTLYSRILSVVCCSWMVVVNCSCERKWSQEWPMLPSWDVSLSIMHSYFQSLEVFIPF